MSKSIRYVSDALAIVEIKNLTSGSNRLEWTNISYKIDVNNFNKPINKDFYINLGSRKSTKTLNVRSKYHCQWPPELGTALRRLRVLTRVLRHQYTRRALIIR